MTSLRALLVDFDGTLADTAPANHASYSAALAEVGIEISRAEFDAVAAGRNYRQFLPEILLQHGVDADPSAIARRKAELYPTFFDRIVLNQGLIALLQLHRTKCSLAVVTTASRANVHAVMCHFELEPLFDLVITGDDVTNHKPAPDAYFLAAERLACLADECLIIEDSDIGVAAGRAFGAKVLRVVI